MVAYEVQAYHGSEALSPPIVRKQKPAAGRALLLLIYEALKARAMLDSRGARAIMKEAKQTLAQDKWCFILSNSTGLTFTFTTRQRERNPNL